FEDEAEALASLSAIDAQLGPAGQETQNQWRVRFADGKEPPLKYFMNAAELRLVKCPHGSGTPGFYPSRPLMNRKKCSGCHFTDVASNGRRSSGSESNRSHLSARSVQSGAQSSMRRPRICRGRHHPESYRS